MYLPCTSGKWDKEQAQIEAEVKKFLFQWHNKSLEQLYIFLELVCAYWPLQTRINSLSTLQEQKLYSSYAKGRRLDEDSYISDSQWKKLRNSILPISTH